MESRLFTVRVVYSGLAGLGPFPGQTHSFMERLDEIRNLDGNLGVGDWTCARRNDGYDRLPGNRDQHPSAWFCTS